LPILDAYGVRATFFVFRENIADVDLPRWHAAIQTGHELGNHTLTHPCSGNFRFARKHALEDYTLDDMQRELSDAQEQIKREWGVVPTSFAYPCGQTFVGRGTKVRSYVPLVAAQFRVGRVAFSEQHSDPEVCDLAQINGVDLDRLSIEQADCFIDRAIEEHGWLVFVGHEVGMDGHPQSVLTQTLEHICRRGKNPTQRLWIDTVETVGNHVRTQQARRSCSS
jgi:hypothetical protein